jgi:tRNA (guanine37-N1)-methyltransferase
MSLRFFVITIFPDFFECFKSYGIVNKALKSGKAQINTINLRDFTEDKHRTVDDVVYGGGPGMLLKPDPIFKAYDYIKTVSKNPYILITEPWGRTFDQSFAKELSQKEDIVIICGRYEGVDERVKTIVNEEVSVGDFILSGGEPAALVIMDSVVRLLPDVLSEEESLKVDSFSDGLLGYPNYTRPAEFRGMKVPDILLSGNHRLISLWRRFQQLKRTYEKRPDLLKKASLTVEDKKMLNYIYKGKEFEDYIKGEKID